MKVYTKTDVLSIPEGCIKYPYRDYDLIEFLKKVEKEIDVCIIYFDKELHYISFISQNTYELGAKEEK